MQHEGVKKKKKEEGMSFAPSARVLVQMLSQIMGANWSARTGVSANGDRKVSANEAGAETTQAKKLAHDPSDPLCVQPNQEEKKNLPSFSLYH